MTRDLNDPTDQPGDGRPAGGDRPRRRVSARVAAVVGLSTAVLMGLLGAVAPALAGPSPSQTGSFNDCLNEAIARITAQGARLPAEQRSAYISTEVAAARTRCGAILSSAVAPTTTATSTRTATTTTSPTSTTTTTSPTSTTTTTTSTTTTSPGRYEVTVTGVVGTGPQTLEANCRTGDQLVTYRYVVGNPTESNASRRVNVSTNGRGVRLTYEVTGTVADPRTSLTAVCRTGS